MENYWGYRWDNYLGYRWIVIVGTDGQLLGIQTG